MTGPSSEGMTIDELARRSGTTSRNIRAYQERGLLPPPRKVGRTGFYDDDHLERLDTIARLLGEGFSLAAIGSLLAAWERGGSLADVLGFEEALTAPFTDEQPEVLRLDELYRQLPGDADGGLGAMRRAEEAGLLALRGDGTAEVLSPRILEVGRLLHDLGMPVDALADELVALRADSDRIARRFVELFLEHVWAPFAAAGAPADGLPAITEALDRTRPTPGIATSSMVAQAMRRQLDEVVQQLLEVATSASADGPDGSAAHRRGGAATPPEGDDDLDDLTAGAFHLRIAGE